MRNPSVHRLVTREAAKRRSTFSIHAAFHVHGVRMIIVALQGAVAGNMAVQASRTAKNGSNGAERLKTSFILFRACLAARGGTK